LPETRSLRSGSTGEAPVQGPVVVELPAPRSVAPLRTRVLAVVVVTVFCLLVVECVMFGLYGPPEMRNSWRWVVSTHLTDTPYVEFVAKQRRIREARARLGMERAVDHPIYGWIYNPGFRLDDPESQIHINSHALRGEEFPTTKPPGEIRILCLGGSTTAGEEVREAETWPAQLQELLRARNPGVSIRVINAGIPTYDVPMSLRLFELDQARFGADIVTIYHGINDLYYHRHADLSLQPSRNYTGRPTMPFVFEGAAERDWSIGPLAPMVDVLARNSYLFNAAHQLGLRLLQAGRPLKSAPDPAGLEAFDRYYRALVRAVAGSGAIPLPMTFAIALPGQFSPHDTRRVDDSFRPWCRLGARVPNEVGIRIMDLQNAAIRRVAQASGLAVSEIAGHVPADRRHFSDICHLTVEGNRRIAAILAADIQPLLDHRRKT
jgi:lysophospholipase L1-like esterase